MRRMSAKIALLLSICAICMICAVYAICGFGQSPQTQTAPLFGVNAKWVNGIAPGYYPQAVTPLASPAGPGLSSSSGGSLAATTYYVEVTYTDAGGESVVSSESALAVSANYVLAVASPSSETNATGWNVYVGTSSGAEALQNSSPLSIGSDWTEPTSGLVSGSSPPSADTSWKAVLIGPGTSACGSPLTIDNYVGGQVAITPSATNYVYLDILSSCAPTVNTTGFTDTSLPLAVVVAGPSSVTSLADDRGIFLGNYNGGSVASVFGRTGTVAAQAGDYSAAQITNAFDLSANNNLGVHYFDVGTQTAPASPASGYDRVYADSTTGNLACVTSSGGSCLPTPTGVNAAELQGVNVSTAPPSNGQTIVYNSADNQYEPTTLSGGSGAWTRIQQIVVSTPANSETLSSIPATYSSLVVVTLLRTDDSSINATLSITFNGDTGANYDREGLQGTNASASAFNTSAGNAFIAGLVPAANASSGNFSDCRFWIPYYASTVADKQIEQNGSIFGTNGSASTYYTFQISGHWRNTAAINSVTFTDQGGGNFVAGSTFTLYGVD